MGSFIHYDLIAEKLEIARTIGFLSNYSLAPIGSARGPEPSVRVWCSPQASDAAVRQYLARLLDGYVSGQDILVIPALASAQSDPEAADAGAPPVAVAA